MFSSTIMPISTMVPIAIAIPANDIMLASTPNNFMAANDINTAMGSVMAIMMLALTCSKKQDHDDDRDQRFLTEALR